MENKNKNIITKEGYEDLQKELKKLIYDERPKVIQEIKEARLLGDLLENAEFDAARSRQGKIEDRIIEIEKFLASAKIIGKQNKNNIKVSIGTIVELEIEKKKYTYKIVGPLEADPFSNKISNLSPLGFELMGKESGAEISFVVENNKKSRKVTGKIKNIKS